MLRDWYEPPAVTEAFDRYTKILESQRGREGMRKGKHAEERALLALLHQLPPWIRTVRAATDVEDSRGIDIVVETVHIGDLYIQIKSSRNGARQYRRKRRKPKVIIVVIDSAMDERKIRAKMMNALYRLRKHFLSVRRGAAPA